MATKIMCLKCDKEKSDSAANFYVNNNDLISSKKVPICKSCVQDYIKNSPENQKFDRSIEILSFLNRPFMKELWSNVDWGEYIKQVSSLPQYKNMKFKDSDILNKNTHKITEEVAEEEALESLDDMEVSKEDMNMLIRFWGKGYEKSSYLWLQNEFEDFTTRYECDSKGMELLIKQICLQELDIEIRRGNGEKVDTQLKTLQDLLGSSNLKPVQETGANAAEQASLGTLIKKYENERPIPKADKAWEDVDGIKKYVRVWFLGHLSRMMGIKNEASKEYEEEISKYTVEPPKYEEDDEDTSL
ncbi:hypothetical protein ABEY43_06520 [Priestia megaterium]